MRSLIPTFLLLVIPCDHLTAQLEEVMDFGADPGHLRMFLRAPSGGADHDTLPLVVALHGCTQDAEELLAITGWDKLADGRGFYLLCPQQRTANNPSHCFNWFRARDAQGDDGEAASIASMIGHALEHRAIDPHRVFIVGVSAGAAMAVNLLACHPELFAAGAAIAGGPFLGGAGVAVALRTMVRPDDRSPEAWAAVVTSGTAAHTGTWPKLILMHGMSDHLVDPRASEELIDQWAALHHTDAQPDSLEQEVDGHAGIERRSYRDSTGVVVITAYRFAGLGHALVIDPGPGPCQGGKVTRLSVDLDFHSTCAIADQFGL